jgi:hypothetical protein
MTAGELLIQFLNFYGNLFDPSRYIIDSLNDNVFVPRDEFISKNRPSEDASVDELEEFEYKFIKSKYVILGLFPSQNCSSEYENLAKNVKNSTSIYPSMFVDKLTYLS